MRNPPPKCAVGKYELVSSRYMQATTAMTKPRTMIVKCHAIRNRNHDRERGGKTKMWSRRDIFLVREACETSRNLNYQIQRHEDEGVLGGGSE